jgi:predicted metal-dependent phosphoesterase TrpH
MRIDLHTHTTASDGTLSPAELVALAGKVGVGILAVADHDTTDSVDPVMTLGGQDGIEVIPAVELNTDIENGEVHVLGYFIDHHQPWLQEFLTMLRNGRANRAAKMVEKLNALGIKIDYAKVRGYAQGSVGRPHVARALVETGAVRSLEEAFDKYIGRQGPAYVERMRVTPADAVRTIARAGGIPVLAHPGWGAPDELIPELIDAGLEGIEVYYPDHTPAMTMRYMKLAQQYSLLMTGGTDFHGTAVASKAPLGSQYVPVEVVEKLKARHADQQRAQVTQQTQRTQ